MAQATHRFPGNVTVGGLVCSGDLTVDGDITATGGMSITGAVTYPDAVVINDSLTVTAGAGQAIDLNATDTAITLDNTTGGISLDSTGASNFTTTGANLTLSTTTSGTLAVTSAGTLNLTSAAASTWAHSGGAFAINSTSQNLTLATVTSGTMALTSAGALNLSSTTGDWQGTGALTIDSSGGAISIGSDAVAQAINIGTGAAARTITVGNLTGATALALRTGTGGLSVAQAANGQAIGVKLLTEEKDLSAEAGFGDTTMTIPANSLVLFVGTYVTTEITGCTTIDVGVAGATTRYGTSGTLTVGSVNGGIDVGGTPRYYAAAAAIRITAVGGAADFTAGIVRVTIHYLDLTAATS